jgi:hypothetical protein
MNVTPELLQTVCSALANGNATRPGVDRELREAFPGIPFTVCDDNDVPSRLKPLVEGEGFALYGVNVSDHCAAMTSNIDASNGLAIALKDDET